MSTYRSATASLSPSVANLHALVSSEHEAVLHGLCSANAAALATEFSLAPVATAPQIESAWARIDHALPGWQQYLPAPALAALTSARHEPLGIDGALTTVAHALAAQERLAMADISREVLAEQGCSTVRVDGGRTSAIQASRGHETFLVVIEDQGSITMDHAGLADATCNDRQRDFVEAMSKRGVAFGDEVMVQHHDPRGGSPIVNASRAGGTSLAHGAVLDGDARPASLVGTLLTPAASTRRRVSEGGAK
jgi:hypothetical protein